MKDKYTIGECKKCKNITVLKNGYCKKCQIEMPNVIKNLFKNFGGK